MWEPLEKRVLLSAFVLAHDISADAQGLLVACSTQRYDTDSSGFIDDVENQVLHLSRYAPDGQLLWRQPYQTNLKSISARVATDVWGNLYVAGEFAGTVDFDPGPGRLRLRTLGQEDVFLLKLDASGRFLWVRQFGGRARQGISGLAVDDSGDAFFCGNSEGTAQLGRGSDPVRVGGTAASKGYVVSVGPSGDWTWARALGGRGTSAISDLALGSSGDLCIGGRFHGTARLGQLPPVRSAGGGDGFFARLSPDGQPLWMRALGGPGDESVSKIAVDEAGNLLMSGQFEDSFDFDPGPGFHPLQSNGFGTVYVASYDAQGLFRWAGKLGGENHWPAGLLTDDAGDVYVSTAFWGTIEFSLGGRAARLSSYDEMSDVLAARISNQGQLRWARSLRGQFSETPWAMARSPSGSLYILQSHLDVDDGGTGHVSVAALTPVGTVSGAWLVH